MKNGIGINKNKLIIDWRSLINREVELLYDNNIYTVKVIDYKNKKIFTNYDGYVYKNGIDCSSFKNGNFGAILGIIGKEFKYKIGERFSDDKRDLIITDRKYKIRERECSENQKYYKYTCNKCGWSEGWTEECHLKRGGGCSCCDGKTVVPEINSIYAKAPWMMKWISEEDAKKYTPQSNKKITVKCPDCGRIEAKNICKIYKNKSIGCICGDGFSYPEKFVYNMLTQLNIDFVAQYSPEYLVRMENGRKSRKYSDFYLPKYSLVIEVDGCIGHKGGIVYNKSKRTIEEHIEIDEWKDWQHKINNINVVRIDCFESNIDYLRDSIQRSDLSQLFDLSRIDWLKCEKFALSNLAKEVCEYWNKKNTLETTRDLSFIFNCSKNTIITYLKIGNKYRWCTYDTKEEMKKNGSSTKKNIEIFMHGEYLGVFDSATELERQSEELFGIKLNKKNISAVCLGNQKTHKGFTFKYV